MAAATPVKCVFLGDTDSGKTDLLLAYTNPTEPCDTYAVKVAVDGKSVDAELWDTDGREEYDHLRPVKYSGAKVFVICFNVVSPTSFDDVTERWSSEIDEHCPGVPIVLVGTNVDLRYDRPTLDKLWQEQKRVAISKEDALSKAKEIKAQIYLEVSVEKQKGVVEVFSEAVRIGLNPPSEEKKGGIFNFFKRKSTPAKKDALSSERKASITLDPKEIKKGSSIGRGAFGVVFKGKYRGQEVAIKEMMNQEYMTPEDEADFMKEVTMMERLRHSAIVSFIGAVLTRGQYQIVLEYCEFGSLTKAMKDHSKDFSNELLKVKCLVDASDSMAFLHRYDIIHRDLKPDNYLIVSLDPSAPVVAKLSDFGTSREVGNRQTKMQMTKGIGTPLFMAPEILKGSNTYDKSVDVYSFSLIMQYVFSGKLPFEGDPSIKNQWDLPNAVIAGKRPEIPASCPEAIKELMQKCWSDDPYERPSFDAIHNFLRKFLPHELDPKKLKKGPVIGKGAFGVVFKGKYRRQDVAIKEIMNQEYMSPQDKADFKKEVDMMARLHHEAIVTFIGAVLVPLKYAIVLEYCQYGSLTSAMKDHPKEFKDEQLKIRCLVDAANAMKFLHSCNIVHRDLKPDNYLVVSLDSNSPVVAKLSDFGTSREVSTRQTKMQMTKGVGTPLFMAPEILQGSDSYDKSVDVYSYALIMYFVFANKLPFEDDPTIKNRWDLPNAIISGRRPPIPEACPRGIRELIARCWSGNPEERPTFEKIYDFLKKFLPKSLDPYELNKGELLGQGSFGAVFKGTYRGQNVAIKEILNQEYMTLQDEAEFKKEVCLIGSLHHETIVKFVGAVLIPGKYAIVSELCQYGDLTNAVKKHTKEFDSLLLKLKCLVDAANAMKFLHENKIIHRDLKTDNYLVTSLNPNSPVAVKLSDFGTSRDLSFYEKNLQMTKGVGSPLYMAPEVLKGSTNYTFAVDVYSFSYIIYFVFSGQDPFEDDPSIQSHRDLYNAIVSGRRPTVPPSCPQGLKELMVACWDDSPSRRPTFDRIYEFLSGFFVEQKSGKAHKQSVKLSAEKQEDRYIAIYAFAGEQEGDLPFNKGDIIYATKKDGAWWEGKCNGSSGIFPSNFVKEYRPEEEAPAQPESSAAAPAAAPAAAKKKLDAYRALYDFAGEQEGDLPFKKGDIIYVTNKEGSWWEGTCHDMFGLFPSNFVTQA